MKEEDDNNDDDQVDSGPTGVFNTVSTAAKFLWNVLHLEGFLHSCQRAMGRLAHAPLPAIRLLWASGVTPPQVRLLALSWRWVVRPLLLLFAASVLLESVWDYLSAFPLPQLLGSAVQGVAGLGWVLTAPLYFRHGNPQEAAGRGFDPPPSTGWWDQRQGGQGMQDGPYHDYLHHHPPLLVVVQEIRAPDLGLIPNSPGRTHNRENYKEPRSGSGGDDSLGVALSAVWATTAVSTIDQVVLGHHLQGDRESEAKIKKIRRTIRDETRKQQQLVQFTTWAAEYVASHVPTAYQAIRQLVAEIEVDVRVLNMRMTKTSSHSSGVGGGGGVSRFSEPGQNLKSTSKIPTTVALASQCWPPQDGAWELQATWATRLNRAVSNMQEILDAVGLEASYKNPLDQERKAGSEVLMTLISNVHGGVTQSCQRRWEKEADELETGLQELPLQGGDRDETRDANEAPGAWTWSKALQATLDARRASGRDECSAMVEWWNSLKEMNNTVSSVRDDSRKEQESLYKGKREAAASASSATRRMLACLRTRLLGWQWKLGMPVSPGRLLHMFKVDDGMLGWLRKLLEATGRVVVVVE